MQNIAAHYNNENYLGKNKTITIMAYLHVFTNEASPSDYSIHEFYYGSRNTPSLQQEMYLCKRANAHFVCGISINV